MHGATRNTTGQYRVQAVFSTPLGLSEYLGIVTPFVLDLALSKKPNVFVRLAAGATLPLILVVILGTDSRFGLMATFLSVMLYLLAWALVHRRRRHGLLGTAIVMAYPALFSVGVLASMFVGRIRAKVWGTGQYNDSTQARYDQLHLALPKMLTHPLGYGVEMGAQAIGYYTPSGLLSVDSFYLSLVMDLGFIGLIAFLTMFIYLCWQCVLATIHSYNEDSETSLLMPAAVSLTAFLVIKMVFAQEDNHPIVFVISSMIVGLLYRNHLVTTRDGATEEPSRAVTRI
jgi:O-antigen ligase